MFQAKRHRVLPPRENSGRAPDHTREYPPIPDDPTKMVSRGCKRCRGPLLIDDFYGEWHCAYCGWHCYESLWREE